MQILPNLSERQVRNQMMLIMICLIYLIYLIHLSEV